MNLKFSTFIPLFAAFALLVSSCSKDDESAIEPTPADKEYNSLSDFSATEYPTPSPNAETNIWSIDDVSATANDFSGLLAALENLTSYTVTIELTNMEEIPSEAFTQSAEVTNMQLKVYAPKATTVKSGAFHQCYNLVSASFPRVTTVEDYAFSYNFSTYYSLTSLELASDNEVVLSSMSNDAFSGVTISDITLTVGESNLENANDNYELVVGDKTIGAFKEIVIKRYTPIEIDSKEELAMIGSAKYYLLSYDYELTDNITLESPFTPIGSSDTAPFTGSFDGANKTILGLAVNSGTYRGLFGYADGATIKNVVVETPTISGGTYTGTLVGYLTGDSTVENCAVTQIGSLTTSTNGGHIGGLVGRVFANASTIKISSCYNTAAISGTATGTNIINAGGLFGRINTEEDGVISVVECYNNGGISTNSSASYLGGIAGQADTYNKGIITITACYNNGILSGSCYDVGGVIGLATSTTSSATITVTSSYNSANINASTAANGYRGGVIGCELPLATYDALEYNKCYFIDSDTSAKGVGNSDSYSDMRVNDLTGLNAVVSSMNSAIKDAGYSDVSYSTNNYYLPSLMGEGILRME